MLIVRFSTVLRKIINSLLVICLIASCSSSSYAMQVYNAIWQGSSGQLPDSICPVWTLGNSADIEVPTLVGDTLNLSTSTLAESMFYQHLVPLYNPPSLLIVEFDVKVGVGTASSSAFSHCAVMAGLGSNEVTILFIDIDRIFLWSSSITVGDEAFVDTDSVFHKYRLEVTSGGVISVYYDDVLSLSGNTYSDLVWGPTPQLNWGDVSSFASGTSEWLYFKHNARYRF